MSHAYLLFKVTYVQGQSFDRVILCGPQLPVCGRSTNINLGFTLGFCGCLMFLQMLGTIFKYMQLGSSYTSFVRIVTISLGV